MDSSKETLSEEWKFFSSLQVFKGRGIDRESYAVLTTDTIPDELIPKLEDQIKFVKEGQQYYLATNANISNAPTASGSSAITVSNSDISLDDVKLLHIKSNMESSGQGNIVIDCPLFDVSQTTPNENFADNTGIFCKRINKFSANESEFPNGLESYLNTTIDGKLLLEKKHNINEYCRKILCKIVLDGLLLKYDRKIPKHAFISASKEIEKVFPGENRHIYFIPYSPRTSTSPKTVSSGKLWAKFTNFKRSLLKCTPDAPVVEKQQDECETEANEDVEKHILFLKHNLEPYDNILFSWNKTFTKRQSMIKELQTRDFFEEFEIVKQPFGYKLFLQDFCALYPFHENKLLEAWPKLSNKVLHLVEQKKILSLDRQNILADPAKYTLALKYFCFLFPPVTIRTKKQHKNWRPSKVEVQTGFFLHVKEHGDLKKAVSHRKSILTQNGEAMQPFVVVQGEIGVDLRSYVVMDDIVYTLETPLKAVDTCFKIFLALNLKYPAESAHIWTFIQQKLYNIYTPFDKYLSAIATVSTDLNIQI